MKIIAAVARDRSGPFALEELDMEEPRDDEVAVRIAGAGICHTDLAQRAGRVPLPVVLGHEGAGIVQSVGTRVSKVSPGDHVVLSFLSCGTCATCQGGMPSYCQNDLACNFAAARLDGSSSLRGRGGRRGRLRAVAGPRSRLRRLRHHPRSGPSGRAHRNLPPQAPGLAAGAHGVTCYGRRTALTTEPRSESSAAWLISRSG